MTYSPLHLVFTTILLTIAYKSTRIAALAPHASSVCLVAPRSKLSLSSSSLAFLPNQRHQSRRSQMQKLEARLSWRNNQNQDDDDDGYMEEEEEGRRRGGWFRRWRNRRRNRRNRQEENEYGNIDEEEDDDDDEYYDRFGAENVNTSQEAFVTGAGSEKYDDNEDDYDNLEDDFDDDYDNDFDDEYDDEEEEEEEEDYEMSSGPSEDKPKPRVKVPVGRRRGRQMMTREEAEAEDEAYLEYDEDDYYDDAYEDDYDEEEEEEDRKYYSNKRDMADDDDYYDEDDDDDLDSYKMGETRPLSLDMVDPGRTYERWGELIGDKFLLRDLALLALVWFAFDAVTGGEDQFLPYDVYP